ncbi:MAG: transcription elongation factor Spt5 [bacterium]|nr:transcription elongation factor Spt5 [bacterium]
MPVIHAVRTIARQEFNAAYAIYNRAKKDGLKIYSIVVLPEAKGYIFVEGESLDEIIKACLGVPKVRGVVRHPPVALEELQQLLLPKKPEIKISVGDIVEITGGPFKGEKAKVIRIDENKREVMVELLNMPIKIPVTLSLEHVRRA